MSSAERERRGSGTHSELDTVGLGPRASWRTSPTFPQEAPVGVAEHLPAYIFPVIGQQYQLSPLKVCALKERPDGWIGGAGGRAG